MKIHSSIPKLLYGWKHSLLMSDRWQDAILSWKTWHWLNRPIRCSWHMLKHKEHLKSHKTELIYRIFSNTPTVSTPYTAPSNSSTMFLTYFTHSIIPSRLWCLANFSLCVQKLLRDTFFPNTQIISSKKKKNHHIYLVCLETLGFMFLCQCQDLILRGQGI
jgi:hypothetical protein